jgi:hypothetical protein
VGTKATAPAAALPLLVGGLVVWSAVGISRRFRRATPQPAKGTGRPLLVVGLVTAAIAVGAFFAIFEQQEDASPGWFTGYTPLMSAQRVATESAYDGSYVIELEAVQGARAEQRLVPKTIYHPALQVTVAGWARLEPGQTEQSDGQITGELVVMDGVREAGRALATLDPGGDWTRLEATGDIEANAEEIELRIGVRDGSMSGAKVQLDELSVRVVGVNGPWNDPVFKGALVDPSGEQGRWALRPLFESIMPGEVSDMASALLNPQPFSKVALWGDYASTQYRSYWGSFGWLSIDLPTLVYLAIGGLIVAAGVGLGMRAIESRKTGWGWPEWLAVVSIVSLGVAIAIGFAKQMALTAYGGLPSAPQGRYLFVLTIPAVWLLGAGLGTLFGKIWPKAAWAWKWAIANALLFLALYSLFALIMPYYYG